MLIKVSTSYPAAEFLRTVPHDLLASQGIQLVVNQPTAACDAWFVIDGLPAAETTVVDPAHVYFIMGEAPGYRRYRDRFLAQFSRVLGYGPLRHPGFVQGNAAHNWWVGHSYAQLQSLQPTKSADLGVVASTKQSLSGHRARVRFLLWLGQHLAFDIAGRGWQSLLAEHPGSLARYSPALQHTGLDKLPGLGPYRYSIAIENSSTPDYWTEKLSDCFLAGTLPFYWGCPNIAAYFPAGSYIPIDIHQPQQALHTIRQAIAQDAYTTALPMLQQARQQVLTTYNLPLFITRLARQWAAALPQPRSFTLQPEAPPSYLERKLRKLQHALGL